MTLQGSPKEPLPVSLCATGLLACSYQQMPHLRKRMHHHTLDVTMTLSSVIANDTRSSHVAPGSDLFGAGITTTRCLSSQLSSSQLVQSSRTDASMRESPTDFRVGDRLKLRLQDIMSPYGDAVLETRAALKSPALDDVLQELQQAYEQRVSRR